MRCHMAVSFNRNLNDAGIPSKILTIRKFIKVLNKNFNPDMYIGIDVIADNINEFWILNPNAFKVKTYNGIKCLTLTSMRLKRTLLPKGSTKIPKPAGDSIGVTTEEVLDRFNERYDYDLKEIIKYNTDFIVEFLRDTIDKDLDMLLKLKDDFNTVFGDKTKWNFNEDIIRSTEDSERIKNAVKESTDEDGYMINK